MKNKSIAKRLMQKKVDDVLQNVVDIFEADDGKPFDEKKELAFSALKDHPEEKLGKLLVDVADRQNTAGQIRKTFWEFRKEIALPDNILLRNVRESDRKGFLALQEIYSPMRSMLTYEPYQDAIWSEHTEGKSLMLSIEKNGTYAGYCGIQNLSAAVWEISVELFPENTRQGIGFAAISAMLHALQACFGVSKYRVRIEPNNYASQRLFEKLGAVPNGISELWIHDPQALEQLENENMHLIDDALISVARKFSVEPRALLRHVLEYKLTWQNTPTVPVERRI